MLDWLLFQEWPVVSHEKEESDVWDPMRQAHPPSRGCPTPLASFTTPYTDNIAGQNCLGVPFPFCLYTPQGRSVCCVN